MNKGLKKLMVMTLLLSTFVLESNVIQVSAATPKEQIIMVDDNKVTRGAIYKDFNDIADETLYSSRSQVPKLKYFEIYDDVYLWTGNLSLTAIGEMTIGNASYYFGVYSGTLHSSGL